MNRYVATEKSTRLAGGVLHLTAEQVKHRAHNLKHLGKNRFEIINPVEFKAGEEFGYEGDLPKALADNLTTKAEAEAAAKKAAAAAEKEQAKAAKEAEKAAADAAKAREKAELEARKIWEADAELRSQYANRFDEYLLTLQS